MKKAIYVAVPIVLVSLVVLQFFKSSKDNSHEASVPTGSASPNYHAVLFGDLGNGAKQSLNPVWVYEKFRQNKPLYLQNTEIPARFSVSKSGDLIVNSDVKDILDYFLLMRGDVDDEDIHSIMLGFIHHSLEEPARTQATEVLEQYLVYLKSYEGWQQEFAEGDNLESNPVALKNRLLQLQELRARTLGEDIDQAFYSEEEQVGLAYAEAKIALVDSSFTGTSRADIIASLNATLPEHIRQANTQAMRQVTLSETMQALKAQGASANEIEQQRIALVGVEANERLKLVDQTRNEWNDKRQRYKEVLAQHSELQETSMEALATIGEIQSIGLNESELRRMQALDRIEHRVQ